MILTPQTSHNMKQMIIVNAALKLPKEKLAAQMAQASAGAFSEADVLDKKIWLKEGRPKIVEKALNEDDLQDLLTKAERRKLPIYRVEGTGATAAGRTACIGIGPANNTEMDALLGVLGFYRWIHENAIYVNLSR